MHILVVEDDHLLNNTLCYKLKHRWIQGGFCVMQAGSGKLY